MTTKRLTRCRHDRKIAGVASGMAEYLDLDPTIVRVVWVLATFLGGFTIPLYVILAIVMPLEPEYGSVPGAAFAAAPGGAMGAAAPAATGTVVGPEGETLAGTVEGAARTFAADAQATAAELGHRHRTSGGGGSFGLVVGILLVVFGSISLVGPMFPGWVAGLHLGPAFILALGVALVIAATRRSPVQG